MWGHLNTCPCSVCKCLPRLFSLISLGGSYSTFIPWVGDRLRVLEAECRDELLRLGPPPGAVPPPGLGPGPASSKGESVGPATPTAPKESEQPPEKDQQLTAKGRPPVPPKNLQQSYSKTGVKEEPPLSPEGGPPGVVEVVDVEASSKKRDRPRSRREHHRHHSPEERRHRDSRRSKDRSDKRKRRTRSRSRRRRDSPKASHSRGRSRKRRAEKPPEPPYPPPDHRRRERPPEPNHPPQGRGWVGPLPVSSHPRWTDSTNKGQVKRAKQERFNRRPRR